MKNFKYSLALVFLVTALTLSACTPDRFGTDEANPSVSSESETATDTATGTDNPITTAEDCVNAADDDGDTLIDCDDSDCATDTTCTTENCVDVLDNDGDGLTDCDDSDCAADTACLDQTESSCNDGVDNDLDLSVDCDDSECATDAACIQDPVATSNLSADFVYSFDPTTDTSSTYRFLSTTGSDTNEDGTENTTCALTVPCATLTHIVGLADAADNILAFEGSYTNSSSVSLGQHSLYGGFFYDTEGKLAANYTTNPTRLVFQGASTLTLDSSTAVTIEGVTVMGSNTDGAVTITNSSPTIKHARLLSRRGRTYNQVVQINQTGDTAMTPVIENTVIISGDTTFDGTQDLVVTPIVIDHTSAGDITLTMTNSTVDSGRTSDLDSTYISAVAHIFAEGETATGGFVLQLEDNVFTANRADVSMGVYAMNLSSAVITNNQFLLSQEDADGSVGVVALGRTASESLMELTGNLINIGAAGTLSSSEATNYGVSLVNVGLTATNNTIIVSDATSARGISAQMFYATYTPNVALKNNFIWVEGTDARNVYLRNGATLTTFTNNYLLNVATDTGELVNDGTTSYTDLSLLSVNSGSLSSTVESDAAVSMRLSNGRLRILVDSTSPLKDAGADSSEYTSEDLDVYGNPRLVNSIVDIGAIEVVQ